METNTPREAQLWFVEVSYAPQEQLWCTWVSPLKNTEVNYPINYNLVTEYTWYHSCGLERRVSLFCSKLKTAANQMPKADQDSTVVKIDFKA